MMPKGTGDKTCSRATSDKRIPALARQNKKRYAKVQVMR